LLSALRALNGDFDALSDAGSLCGGDGREALVLGLLAGLTSLRLVLQTLVVKEYLLACGPDKVLPAINTLDIAIVELRLALAPLSICFAGNMCFWHDLSPHDYELTRTSELMENALRGVQPIVEKQASEVAAVNVSLMRGSAL
jgi:hypothetical protein